MARLGKNDHTGEGGRIWDHFCKAEHDRLEASDVGPRDIRYFHSIVSMHCTYYQAPRFFSRYPANCLRLTYFQKIFPEARFVHLIRNGYAVCRSVLRMREQDGTLKEWWGVRPEGWERMNEESPHEAVAHQWAEVTRQTREDGRSLPEGSYLEIRYEEICERPQNLLNRFYAFCDLPPDSDVGDEVKETAQNRNYKFCSEFSREEMDALNRYLAPAHPEFGYEVL